jgi:hypothetical protein
LKRKDQVTNREPIELNNSRLPTSFYRNDVRSVNKLTKLPSDNAIVIETVEGSGKGSKFSLIWQEISPSNTHITLDGEFVFQSPPGRPLDDVIRKVAEKRLDEDVHHIEQLSSSDDE